MASNAPVSTYDVKDLLESAGYGGADPHFTAHADDDAFETQHGAESTPLLFVEDEPIGGVEDLRRWLARNAH